MHCFPNLSEKERSNMDHWVVNNQHRVQLLQEMVETSISEGKAPDREALSCGKTVREGYRPRAFTEYWDVKKGASGVANFGEENRAKVLLGERSMKNCSQIKICGKIFNSDMLKQKL